LSDFTPFHELTTVSRYYFCHNLLDFAREASGELKQKSPQAMMFFPSNSASAFPAI